MEIPKSFYVYEFSYPEEMSELAGIIFYVGKGTSLTRMDDHFREAAKEKCACAKCEAIRSVWAVGLAVTKNVVFASRDETATLNKESRRIIQHYSPYLTNRQLPNERTSLACLDDQYAESTQLEVSNEPEKGSGSSHLTTWADAMDRWISEAETQHSDQNGVLHVLSGQVLLYGIDGITPTLLDDADGG